MDTYNDNWCSCLLFRNKQLTKELKRFEDFSDVYKRQVYRFNSDGRFLNKIGQHGNAPGEYNVAYSISVDQESQYLLYYVGQKKVQFWGYDGLFQKEIQLRSEWEITVGKMLNTDRLLAEKRSYSDDGLQIYIELFDMEGNLLKQIPMNSDSQKVSLTMKTVPLMYTYGSLSLIHI